MHRLSLPLAAQEFENFHIELTGSAWLVNTSGTIQSRLAPVSLTSDPNIEGNQPQFFGRMVVKPARRHRLWVEGSPYQLTRFNRISRSITFAGRWIREDLRPWTLAGKALATGLVVAGLVLVSVEGGTVETGAIHCHESKATPQATRQAPAHRALRTSSPRISLASTVSTR